MSGPITDPALIALLETSQASINKTSAPTPGGRTKAKTSADDRKQLSEYRKLSDGAANLEAAEAAFSGPMERFKTSQSKNDAFEMMYPDTSGWGGSLKALGGAVLRGTLGWTYSNQDHADYKFLRSRQSAINNAALSLNTGVQTKSDEVRVARQNIDPAMGPAANRAIMQEDKRSIAIARARAESSARWVGHFGSLSGTQNPRGLTYDEWFEQEGKPNALRRVGLTPTGRTAPRPKPNTPKAPQGWGGFKEVK